MENEIKLLIIESLFLEDIKPEDIKNDEALFGDGLGLDTMTLIHHHCTKLIEIALRHLVQGLPCRDHDRFIGLLVTP